MLNNKTIIPKDDSRTSYNNFGTQLYYFCPIHGQINNPAIDTYSETPSYICPICGLELNKIVYKANADGTTLAKDSWYTEK